MEVLRFSFGAVGPVILLIALGFFIRRIDMVREGDIDVLTRLVFQIFLPAMTFNNIASVDFSSDVSPRLMIYAGVSIFALVGVLCLILWPLIRDRSRRLAVVHLLYRSNFLVLGMALMGNLYGEEGVRLTALLTPVTIIPFNLLAVILLSAASADSELSTGQLVRKTLRDIITNPLIASCAVGSVFALCGLSLPGVVDSAIHSVGVLASPLSIILLGVQLDFGSLRSNARQVVLTAAGRLILVPLIMVGIAILCGFRGVELCVLFVLYGAPSATSVAIMTRIYKVHPVYSAQTVVLTNGVCCATIFVGLSILRAAGLI